MSALTQNYGVYGNNYGFNNNRRKMQNSVPDGLEFKSNYELKEEKKALINDLIT